MPKRADEHQNDIDREVGDAERWLSKHEDKLDKVIETEQHQDQVMLDGVRRLRMRYLGMWGEGEDDEVTYDESRRFVPLVATPDELDVQRIAHNKRVERAFETLKPEQRDLLVAWALEGKTLTQLRKHGESRQAVHERVAWAKNALVKAILATAEEPVVVTAEDL